MDRGGGGEGRDGEREMEKKIEDNFGRVNIEAIRTYEKEKDKQKSGQNESNRKYEQDGKKEVQEKEQNSRYEEKLKIK